MYVPSLNFKACTFMNTEEVTMSLLVFYYCTCIFFCRCRSFNLSYCVVCRHFCCLMSLFQGHSACWNFTLTSPWTAPPPPPLFEGLSCVVGTSVGKKSTQHFGEEK